MDWQKFDFEYRLDANGLMTDLISIEAYKESATNLVLPPKWRDQLDRLNRIRAIHGTTALEGNPLSEAEVGQQVDIAEKPEEAAKRKATKEQMQIRNAGVAQSWVKMRFEPAHAPLRLSDILHMHKTITSATDESHNVPGEFRTFPVTVGSPALGGVHKGAPHLQVPAMMEDYIKFVASPRLQDQHPVIRALLAHFFLVTIHPFGDGNGRVSRLVEAGILFQGGYNVLGFYGLSNYFYRNDDKYKTTLQECRKKQPFDVTPFIRFGLKGFAEELKGINNFIKTKLNRVVYRNMLVQAFNIKASERRRVLNQREFHLLEFLLRQTEPVDPFSENPSRQIKFSELKDSPFVKAAYRTVTARTFERELTRLSELGFIKFMREEGSPQEGPIVELDFGAIGKY